MWTDEKAAKLLELDASGLSARECAEILGETKNSVIGKLNRMRQGSTRHVGGFPPRHDMTDEFADEVERLAWRGLNAIQIADELYLRVNDVRPIVDRVINEERADIFSDDGGDERFNAWGNDVSLLAAGRIKIVDPEALI